MDADTGQFVTGDQTKPGMNRYTTGEQVSIGGDRFVVVSFENVERNGETRGEMLLRAMKLSETQAQEKTQKSLSEFLRRNEDGSPTNRKQRRQRKHALEKMTRKIQRRDQERTKQ